ncbi:MAG: hypothetical protein WC212_08520 [Candidatus Delongbacteria bacterium]|jgi:uncharacterized Zn finger protein (UPF0148 family)
MFENLIKNLENLNGKEISVPILSDSEGYYDRECPDEECKYLFKVKSDDWENIVDDGAVYCPLCGIKSTKSHFATTSQLEFARKQAGAYISGIIHNSLVEGAKDFNRRQNRNDFISLSMKVTGQKRSTAILPVPAKDVFERKVICEKCNCNYAVVGSAFFCPFCGHNSVENTFDNSIATTEASIKYIPTIRDFLSKMNKDESEMTCRSIIEKSLCDCVTALQRYCEVSYRRHPSAIEKVPFNAFQKIDTGSKLWKDLLGQSYQDWLKSDEFTRFGVLFQRRHLLQHAEGFVDQLYLDKTKDHKYALGQRVIVKEADVLELSGYVKTIVNEIKKRI